MTTATKRPKVSARLVKLMTAHYGTIEAARDAYRVARDEVRAAGRMAGLCLWVTWEGRITVESVSSVSYSGSVDGYNILPC